MNKTVQLACGIIGGECVWNGKLPGGHISPSAIQGELHVERLAARYRITHR